MASFLSRIFGSYSDREIKKINPIIEEIESLDEEMSALKDEDLQAKTLEFKNRLDEGESLEDILPEAFAVVREASWRVLGMKHFRVQLIGGLILHQGRIAEMKTGEGKTLVATLPAYLNALRGRGVHVITVNDYLAQRDMEWMGKVYEFLGLTTGCIVHGISGPDRKAAYNADITYGTNNEFGFDYLRDNMVIYKEEMSQRDLYFAIVDEVDSILVDEARTPLIISGAGDKSTKLYEMADNFVQSLSYRIMDLSEGKADPFDREIKEETVDFLIDEKAKTCSLTEQGTSKVEEAFGIENLSDMDNMEIAHHVNQALKARNIMKRDTDYVVKDGEIIIVDEFTGRLMYGRRYSDGLHQAIEAKEKLNVKSESKTLATVTFQNYFRMYEKLSGMTGTAKTEEDEFREIYNMDVVEIPTNKPILREDLPDSIYAHEEAKFDAVAKEIKERHASGQPILVGTISIDRSEALSRLLKREGIPHEVLNAKHHDREAEIVAQAGRFGSVTIATNMAGRGTDIVLGGNPEFLSKLEMRKKGISEDIIAEVEGTYDTEEEEVLEARKLYKKLYEKYRLETDENNKKVLEAGGLHIIGTERHESRRIDNQLRGRAGRQGDPGSSRFYIGLDDDLMRLFGGERMASLVETLDVPEDEPMEHRILTRSIENAQKKVEGNNFAIRKHVLKYDDVMNKQREVIYGERKKVLEGEDLRDHIQQMAKQLVEEAVDLYTMESNYPEEWDIEGLEVYLANLINVEKGFLKFPNIQEVTKDILVDRIMEIAEEEYKAKEEEFGEEKFREVERVILLQVVDTKWMEHIDAMDQLRQGIGLRAYGQEDPVRAYQMEGFDMFDQMTKSISEDTIKFLYQMENPEKLERKRVAEPTKTSADDLPRTVVNKERKIGRNEACPCGSGKKYKRCCGK